MPKLPVKISWVWCSACLMKVDSGSVTFVWNFPLIQHCTTCRQKKMVKDCVSWVGEWPGFYCTKSDVPINSFTLLSIMSSFIAIWVIIPVPVDLLLRYSALSSSGPLHAVPYSSLFFQKHQSIEKEKYLSSDVSKFKIEVMLDEPVVNSGILFSLNSWKQAGKVHCLYFTYEGGRNQRGQVTVHVCVVLSGN